VKTIDRGKLTENEACLFLEKQGLKLIEKNYRCRNGEIDLIMQDQETLVFVEVRYRTNNSFGSAVDSVDHGKIQKLIAAANHYVAKHQVDRPMRFDVIGFDASLKPDWINNAFPAF